MDVFGVKLLGLNTEVGIKVLATLALVLALVALRVLVERATRGAGGGEGHSRASGAHVRFWTRQVSSLVALAVLIFGVAAVWFDNAARLATVAGLLSAGIAVALQRVITSFAAYFIILRGRVFTVGDRITMGGVRGDVVALGFMQTTVLEMGEPPPVQSGPPPVWVEARQYTGRLVRVTNDKIFDSPVYNYTREFPFLWEEMHVPITYDADRHRAEAILLDAARRHTADLVAEASPALEAMCRRYFLPEHVTLEPSVYYRLTDNWLELAVRFVAPERGARALKDAMSRDILAAFDAAGIGIASGTYDIVGLPTLRVELTKDAVGDGKNGGPGALRHGGTPDGPPHAGG